jgi:hypothetical protein
LSAVTGAARGFARSLVVDGKCRNGDVAGVLPAVGDQRHPGVHLQLGECVQINLGSDHRTVTQPATHPIQWITEDSGVVAALVGGQPAERAEVTTLELFETGNQQCCDLVE